MLRISSNWIAAAPNALGDARRNNAWLRAKVKSRESSWSAISEEAEATEVVNNRPAGELVVVDIDVGVGKRSITGPGGPHEFVA